MVPCPIPCGVHTGIPGGAMKFVPSGNPGISGPGSLLSSAKFTLCGASPEDESGVLAWFGCGIRIFMPVVTAFRVSFIRKVKTSNLRESS